MIILSIDPLFQGVEAEIFWMVLQQRQSKIQKIWECQGSAVLVQAEGSPGESLSQ